ncbi:hypothetical protein [Brucella pseudogrignonensis]
MMAIAAHEPTTPQTHPMTNDVKSINLTPLVVAFSQPDPYGPRAV